jgi:transposase
VGCAQRWSALTCGWSQSSARRGCWSTGCWMPGCGSWLCIPTRWRPPGIGFARRAGSQIGLTGSCCVSWRGPTLIASGSLNRTLIRTKAVRALTRAREDLVAARVAMANQLRAELERFWPAPIGLFNDLDSPISLAFLQRYPSPKDAHRLGEKRLAAFLKNCNYNNRKTASELLARLRQAPVGRAGQVETEMRRQIVLALVATLQTMVAQIAGLDTRIARALDAHPDGEIFRSFFRSQNSVVCAATLLAEIGDCRARYPHRDAIAADSGQAPVAIESGNRKSAKFRWACNKRLRNALAVLAHSTKMWNPWAQDRYAHARARGHHHRRALRTLGRALSRIIWRCWQNHTPYDPKRHTGLQQHITVTIPPRRAPGPTSSQPSRWPARRSSQH